MYRTALFVGLCHTLLHFSAGCTYSPPLHGYSGNCAGDTSSAMTVTSCKTLCDSTASCLAYTYNNAMGTCTPNTCNTAVPASSMAMIHYPNKNCIAGCTYSPPLHGYSGNCAGDTSSAMTVTSCKTLCDSTASCLAYTYNNAMGTCTPNTCNTAVPASSMAMIHYPNKNCIEPCTYTGPQQGYWGKCAGDTSTSMSILECNTFCDATPTCMAYTYDHSMGICTPNTCSLAVPGKPLDTHHYSSKQCGVVTTTGETTSTVTTAALMTTETTPPDTSDSQSTSSETTFISTSDGGQSVITTANPYSVSTIYHTIEGLTSMWVERDSLRGRITDQGVIFRMLNCSLIRCSSLCTNNHLGSCTSFFYNHEVGHCDGNANELTDINVTVNSTGFRYYVRG